MFKRKNGAPDPAADPQDGEGRRGLFARMKQGLSKTRGSFTKGLERLVAGKRQIDDELLEELETLLITADIGVEATTEIIDAITDRVKRRDLDDPQALVQALREHLVEAVSVPSEPLDWQAGEDQRVVLVVGVNGVGKTTTIG
ncbi:MAG TPA: signal recognition particle receptor subunit alpha, partial [Gammaproteobacteria bacterium]|nr:signal recognition particle receptor subunit alpha [Gammaproteobacteria bacterium]